MLNKLLIKQALTQDIDSMNEVMWQTCSNSYYTKTELGVVFKENLITKLILNQSIAYVASLDGIIVGFFVRKLYNKIADDRIYISPAFQNFGIGKKLWEQASIATKRKGLEYISMIVDTNAVGFYQKMGAIIIGDHDSKILDGYNFPIMKYDLINISDPKTQNISENITQTDENTELVN